MDLSKDSCKCLCGITISGAPSAPMWIMTVIRARGKHLHESGIYMFRCRMSTSLYKRLILEPDHLDVRERTEDPSVTSAAG